MDQPHCFSDRRKCSCCRALSSMWTMCELNSNVFTRLCSHFSHKIFYYVSPLWSLKENQNLSSTLSDSIGNFKHLRQFGANGSPISGSIPASIGNWTSLQEFWAHECNFESTLPSSIGNWRNLTVFSIRDNALLSGSIPSEVSNWDSIEAMHVQGTNLTGPMPFCSSPSIANSTIDIRADCDKVVCFCCSECFFN